MTFLNNLFKKASYPPPTRTNKTIEERKAELIARNHSGYSVEKRQRSPLFKLLLPILLVMAVFFIISLIPKAPTEPSFIQLSPLYPDYSALVDITANSDIIYRGIVIGRGPSRFITVKDENKVTKKTLFTPVSLTLVTPIKGEFKGNIATYLELGGEKLTQVVEVKGVLPLATDDEVFLFYQDNDTGFGKWSVYYVNDGMVKVESERLPPSVASNEKYTSISADDFAVLVDSLL